MKLRNMIFTTEHANNFADIKDRCTLKSLIFMLHALSTLIIRPSENPQIAVASKDFVSTHHNEGVHLA